MKTNLLLITAAALGAATFAWGQTGAGGTGGSSGASGGTSTGVATGTTPTDAGAPAAAIPPSPTAGSAAAESRMSHPVDAGAASAVPPTATSAGSPMESAVRGSNPTGTTTTGTGAVDPVLGGNAARSPIGPAPALNTATPGSVPPVSSIHLPAGTVSPGTAPVGAEPLRATREVLDRLGATNGRNPPNAGESARNPPDGASPEARAAAPQPGPEPGAATSTFVSTPPPPAHRETVTPAESSDHLWVPGHYTWDNGQWTWVAGQWTRPPAPGATWVPGRYDEQTKRWTGPHWNTATGGESQGAGDRAR